jgi:hypothetical protein
VRILRREQQVLRRGLLRLGRTLLRRRLLRIGGELLPGDDLLRSAEHVVLRRDVLQP